MTTDEIYHEIGQSLMDYIPEKMVQPQTKPDTLLLMKLECPPILPSTLPAVFL